MADGAGKDGAGQPVPERIGRYRIVGELGRGGMAVVYRAFLDGPRGFAKEACLKRILPGAADDPSMVDMFEREARIAATLQHANVVQVFDFDLHEGTPFLVMELVDGPSLWQLFGAASRAGRPLPVDVACGIVLQVLHGLHHVHTRTLGGRLMGLVHRDVSLHNILVARTGEVKVADFGIARATQLGERTRTGVLKGKLAYIAPEYAATGKADHRGDLFSAGVVLFELLAGKRRVPPATEAEGLGWVLHPSFESLTELRPEVPDRLAAVVASLTAALPDDRPADAAEAARSLAEAAGAPADAAAIARCMAGLLPREDAPAREPTLLAVGGEAGDTIPTPSPFDPTVTRTSDGPDGAAAGPKVRTELTPDASTALADGVARGAAAARRRRRAWWGGAGLAAAALVAGVVLAVGAFRGGGGTEERSPVREVAAGAGREAAVPVARIEPAEEPSAVPVPFVPVPATPSAPPPAVETPASVDAPAEAGTAADAGAADAGAAPPPDAGRRERDGGAARDAARPAVHGGGGGAPATGTLFLSIRPWAYVSLDGGPATETTVRELTLAAGPHRVRVDDGRNDCHFEVPVDVPAGGRVEVVEDLARRCGSGRAAGVGGDAAP